MRTFKKYYNLILNNCFKRLKCKVGMLKFNVISSDRMTFRLRLPLSMSLQDGITDIEKERKKAK